MKQTKTQFTVTKPEAAAAAPAQGRPLNPDVDKAVEAENNKGKKQPRMTIAMSPELHYQCKEFVHEQRDISHADIYKLGLKILMTERNYKFKK